MKQTPIFTLLFSCLIHSLLQLSYIEFRHLKYLCLFTERQGFLNDFYSVLRRGRCSLIGTDNTCKCTIKSSEVERKSPDIMSQWARSRCNQPRTEHTWTIRKLTRWRSVLLHDTVKCHSWQFTFFDTFLFSFFCLRDSIIFNILSLLAIKERKKLTFNTAASSINFNQKLLHRNQSRCPQYYLYSLYIFTTLLKNQKLNTNKIKINIINFI